MCQATGSAHLVARWLAAWAMAREKVAQEVLEARLVQASGLWSSLGVRSGCLVSEQRLCVCNLLHTLVTYLQRLTFFLQSPPLRPVAALILCHALLR